MTAKPDVMDLVSTLKLKGEAFVLATVVRTVSVTAAKAGAKAVIRVDGSIEGGWIGGGCARGAVLKAAQEVLKDGKPRLISVQPPDDLQARGVRPGESRDGVRFARNMCPSKGTMDIFIEPVMPRPSLIICGASPVAQWLAKLGTTMGYDITVCAPPAEQDAFELADRRIEGYALGVNDESERFIVISTQGKGDEVAVRAALGAEASYKAFVGSRRKMAALRAELVADGLSPDAIDAIKAPAGLDIGAITPEEIALSILSEIVTLRRKAQRSQS
ncbi:MAG: XdhC/CoxI family protein [Alphaproteobacteria bacterium]|nr:XdhC/CoxI family protein [Alphaproteobacteria bacterium]